MAQFGPSTAGRRREGFRERPTNQEALVKLSGSLPVTPKIISCVVMPLVRGASNFAPLTLNDI